MKQDKLNIDKLLSGYKVPDTKSKAQAFEQLTQKIEANQSPQFRPNKTSKIYYLVGSGAVAALLTLFFLLTSPLAQQEFKNKQLATIQTKLPDNSLVKLKTNSTLEYHQGLIDGTRKVEMQGEAFFEVTKGKSFKVHFPGGHLKVLGTKFNILSYNKDYGRVDCYEGSVQLEIRDRKIVLTKGQGMRYTPTTVEGPIEFDIQEAMKIPDNSYKWVNRPLSEILALICARSNYQLVAPEKVLNRRFTGTLSLTNDKIALTILSKALHFTYEQKGQKLVILEEDN